LDANVTQGFDGFLEIVIQQGPKYENNSTRIDVGVYEVSSPKKKANQYYYVWLTTEFISILGSEMCGQKSKNMKTTLKL